MTHYAVRDKSTHCEEYEKTLKPCQLLCKSL